MTDTATVPSPTPVRRSTGIVTGLILVAGVGIVPAVIVFLSNSWEAADAAAYVRMAFASVAAATIAIVTVIGLLIWDIVRRHGVGQIVMAAILAAGVTYFALSTIASAADLLLLRLALP